MKEEKPYIITSEVETIRKYNPRFGDERVCKCGHSYYRHFDSYEGMEPVGCKYCGCSSFEEEGSTPEVLYFAKYLPVEGEIKEGDWYWDKLLDTYGPNIDKFLESSYGDISGVKGRHFKVKLFLCSRDIQVGDKVQFQLIKGAKFSELTCIDKDFVGVQLKGNDDYVFHTTPDKTNQCFKVTGQISPDATWVKEGDEFDEENIQIWDLKLNVQWTPSQYQRRLKSPTDYLKFTIRVKCPTCKKFH